MLEGGPTSPGTGVIFGCGPCGSWELNPGLNVRTKSALTTELISPTSKSFLTQIVLSSKRCISKLY